MCNPRRIRVEATRRLSEAWTQEVRRQVRLNAEAVGRARVRQPLGTVLGGPVLLALERALEQRDGWHEVPEGFRHDLDGGYVVYHVDTRELETVAELRTQVSAEQEASTQVSGVVEDTLRVEGEGRYYDDGWGGLTERSARRDADSDARARLDQAGFQKVGIFVSGGFDPERIAEFMAKGAPVAGFGVGSYISGARPIDFTADLHEVEGKPIAKRGRIPGITPSPRLKRVL